MRKILVLLFMVYSVSFIVEAADERIKIAIIDTGASSVQLESKSTCKDGIHDYIGDSGHKSKYHGTNIYGIINKKLNNKTHCIVVYRVWESDVSFMEVVKNTAKAVKHATKTRVKFINISMGGNAPYFKERAVIKRAIDKGIFVIVAAGNDGKDLNKGCHHYPACYKKDFPSDFLRVVSTHTLKSSNYGKVVTDREKGRDVEGGGITLSGTSQATAVLTSKLINK